MGAMKKVGKGYQRPAKLSGRQEDEIRFITWVIDTCYSTSDTMVAGLVNYKQWFYKVGDPIGNHYVHEIPRHDIPRYIRGVYEKRMLKAPGTMYVVGVDRVGPDWETSEDGYLYFTCKKPTVISVI